MSVKKLSELTYKDQKVKIGSSTLDAIKSISNVESQSASVEKVAETSSTKQEVDLEQLKILFAKELEAIELEAKAKGEKEGFEQGIKKAKEDAELAYVDKNSELKKQLSLLVKLEETLVSKQEEILKSEQNLLLEVIYTIISKLVTNVEFYEDYINKTINDISFKNKEQAISISIHPDDKKLLEKQDLTKQLTNIKIYEDSSITSGGVYIESDDRTIDARLETILINTKKLLQTKTND